VREIPQCGMAQNRDGEQHDENRQDGVQRQPGDSFR
jgi:hypothetical protein